MNTSYIKLKPDHLIKFISDFFNKIPDHRANNKTISLKDTLMSAYAIFSLKIPSLLKFDEDFRKGDTTNLSNLFNIINVPSDTQMREIIDGVNPKYLKPCFPQLFKAIQRQKKLEAYEFFRRNNTPYYLMPVDATTYFSSGNIRCKNCIERNQKGQSARYYHQMFTAAIVHPDLKTVIPISGEAISNEFGDNKQDSEHKAFKRFYKRFKSDHPKLKIIMCGDALYSTFPVVNELILDNQLFILSIKEGYNKSLFKFMQSRLNTNVVKEITEEEVVGDKVKKNVKRLYRYINNVQFNKTTGQDIEINLLDFYETVEWECKGEMKKEEKRFTWATNIYIDEKSIKKIVKGGRSRWKIENEVFNTIKTKGYNFEHNYGHGNKYLSENFSYLMMLAFFIDQILEMTNKQFIKIMERHKRKIRIWEIFKNIYNFFYLNNFEELFHIAENPDKYKMQANTS